MSNPFAVDDLVRVIQVAPNSPILLDVGTVGIIGDVRDTHVFVLELDPEGNTRECAWIHYSDLATETRPEWIKAKELHITEFLHMESEYHAQVAKEEEEVASIAAKYGLTVETAKAVYHEIRCVYDAIP